MPIIDLFSDYQPGLSSPASDGFDITPDDANDLTVLPRAVMVAGGGDLGVVLMDGSTGRNLFFRNFITKPALSYRCSDRKWTLY